MKWRHPWVVCCCLPARRARASLATADRGYTIAAILTCKARRRKPYWTVKHKPHSLERDGHWPSKLTFVFHALNRRSHKAAYLYMFTYLRRSNSEITRKISDVNLGFKTSKCTWGKISGLLRFCFQGRGENVTFVKWFWLKFWQLISSMRQNVFIYMLSIH